MIVDHLYTDDPAGVPDLIVVDAKGNVLTGEFTVSQVRRPLHVILRGHLAAVQRKLKKKDIELHSIFSLVQETIICCCFCLFFSMTNLTLIRLRELSSRKLLGVALLVELEAVVQLASSSC